MSRYEQLMSRIQDGKKVLLDGATGTELVVRGVEMVDDAWIGHAALHHPDLLRQVHADYIRLGAEIVVANTFATSRHILEDAGLDKNFETINRRSVELVLEARQETGADHVIAAAGVANWSFSGKHPSLEQLYQNIKDECTIFADAGAELLTLEMMVDVERMLVTLDAAQTCGLPVWVGFSVKVDEEGVVRLWDGPTLQEGIEALKDKNVPVISIMHSGVATVDPSLDIIDSAWNAAIGVYAHQSNWRTGNVISPADYAATAQGWLNRGVQIIGTCCGLGVDHIAALNKVVK